MGLNVATGLITSHIQQPIISLLVCITNQQFFSINLTSNVRMRSDTLYLDVTKTYNNFFQVQYLKRAPTEMAKNFRIFQSQYHMKEKLVPRICKFADQFSNNAVQTQV